jgi:hypothetical protein
LYFAQLVLPGNWWFLRREKYKNFYNEHSNEKGFDKSSIFIHWVLCLAPFVSYSPEEPVHREITR